VSCIPTSHHIWNATIHINDDICDSDVIFLIAGEETSLIALKTISKWLTFDSKFSNILKETGLLHILIDHCGRLCKNVAIIGENDSILSLDWFEKNHEMISAEGRKVFTCDDDERPETKASSRKNGHDYEDADSQPADKQDHAWMRWEGTAMKVKGMCVTKILPSPEFSVALLSTPLGGKKIDWKVTVGRTSRGWCGVGVASRDIELGESLRQAGPTGRKKQGRAWFYHDRGFFCNGEIFCDDTVPPFEWKDSKCIIGVHYDGILGEVTFSCNDLTVPGKIMVGVDGGLFPAVYCSDVGTWFEMELMNPVVGGESEQRLQNPLSAPADSNSMSELKRNHYKMALKTLCTSEDAKLNTEIHYSTLLQSIDRLIDYREASKELGVDLQGLTWEEKQVICDRIWAAAKPPVSSRKLVKRKQSIYSMLPSAWSLRLDTIVDLMILIAEGERAGIDEVEPVEIGQIALYMLRTYVRLLDDFRYLSKRNDSQDSTEAKSKASTAPKFPSFVTKKTFDLVMETLAMILAGNHTNISIANENGLFRSMLVLIQTDDYREGSMRYVSFCAIAGDCSI
jgi:hypothetical protein